MKNEILKEGTLNSLLKPADQQQDEAKRKADKDKAKRAIKLEFGTLSRFCRQYALPREPVQAFLDDKRQQLPKKYHLKFREGLTLGLLPVDWHTIRPAFVKAVDKRQGGMGYKSLAFAIDVTEWRVSNMLRSRFKVTENPEFGRLYSFAKALISRMAELEQRNAKKYEN